jgi:autotransporter-associated beta strand protein
MMNSDYFRLKISAVMITVPCALLALALPSGFAGDATWKANPSNGIWNRAANWDPMKVPSHPKDRATFASSSQTAISFRSPVSIGSAVFDAGASSYNFSVGPSPSLDFTRNGLTNNSGVVQNFVATTDISGNFGLISFSRRTTAGAGCIFTTKPGMFNGATGSLIQFNNSATAGTSTFVNNGASIPGSRGGETDFFDNTSADAGTFTAKAGTAFGTEGGTIAFFGSSTAATGEFTAEGGAVLAGSGGSIYLRESSTGSDGRFTLQGGSADSTSGASMYVEDAASLGLSFIFVNGGQSSGTSNGATLNLVGSSHPGGSQIFVFGLNEDAEPGTLYFYDDSNAEEAILRLTDGVLDISPHNPGTVILGNILGYYGTVYLGANNLEIGGNNIVGLLEEVSFHDGGIAGGSGGSITKAGSNLLELEVPSNFTGGMTVKKGTLSLHSPTGSASGSGPVVVNGGNLQGYYTIDGPVTVNGGNLVPWGAAIGNYYGSFETKSTVTLAAGSAYKWDLNTDPVKADLLIAHGVTIDSAATFVPGDFAGNKKMPAGTVLMAISNVSANPIAGTFKGLPEGSMIALGQANIAQVSYAGGDGNDFTLTVLP